MSHKRRREETSEQIHTHHKRLKDDHGEAHRVDPLRFEKAAAAADQTYTFSPEGATLHDDPFSMPLPDDDDHTNTHNTNSEVDDSDFGLLLYELASLDVGSKKKDTNDEPQTCPVCSSRVSLKQFPDHVHHCLDMMDSGDRNSMKSQIELDSDFATQYALKHGYVTDYTVSCPICGQQLMFGTGMNEHVNQCMDESEKKQQENMEDDEDDDINVNNHNNNSNKVDVLSREQMIECASKLMTLQQGSEQFGNMLDMFGALGFNKQNVKSVLEIEKNKKKQNENEHNRNSNNTNGSNGTREMSPIAEEDVDLFSFDDADL